MVACSRCLEIQIEPKLTCIHLFSEHLLHYLCYKLNFSYVSFFFFVSCFCCLESTKNLLFSKVVLRFFLERTHLFRKDQKKFSYSRKTFHSKYDWKQWMYISKKKFLKKVHITVSEKDYWQLVVFVSLLSQWL